MIQKVSKIFVEKQLIPLNDRMQTAGIDMLVIDEDFIKQYQIKVLAGTLSQGAVANENMDKVIINEALLKKLGYRHPQNAIGKRYREKERSPL